MDNKTKLITRAVILLQDTVSNDSNFSSIEPYVIVLVFMCLVAVAVPFIITPNNTTYEMNSMPNEVIEMNNLAQNRGPTPELPIQTRNIQTGEVLANPNPVEDSDSEIWENIDLGNNIDMIV